MIARHFMLAATAAVAFTAPLAAQTKPVYGSWGYDTSAMDRLGEAGRRLLVLCER